MRDFEALVWLPVPLFGLAVCAMVLVASNRSNQATPAPATATNTVTVTNWVTVERAAEAPRIVTPNAAEQAVIEQELKAWDKR